MAVTTFEMVKGWFGSDVTITEMVCCRCGAPANVLWKQDPYCQPCMRKSYVYRCEAIAAGMKAAGLDPRAKANCGIFCQRLRLFGGSTQIIHREDLFAENHAVEVWHNPPDAIFSDGKKPHRDAPVPDWFNTNGGR